MDIPPEQLSIRIVTEDAEVRRCAPLLRDLRPMFETDEALLAQVARQREGGYMLAAAFAGDRVVGVAGFRQLENLVHGVFLYVDDLVVDPGERGRGTGRLLLQWLTDRARAEGANHLALDTALANAGAQKLYLNQGLAIVGFHLRRRP